MPILGSLKKPFYNTRVNILHHWEYIAESIILSFLLIDHSVANIFIEIPSWINTPEFLSSLEAIVTLLLLVKTTMVLIIPWRQVYPLSSLFLLASLATIDANETGKASEHRYLVNNFQT